MLTADKNNPLKSSPDLKEGTMFRQNFPNNQGLIFTIKEINRESGRLRVTVNNPKTDHVHEENWDGDIMLLETALEIKEYILM